jgi:predicted transcriptional regulator
MKNILNYLKNGDKSTTSIANQFNRNFYDAMKFLEELEKEGKIIKITMGRFTYWRLKR